MYVIRDKKTGAIIHINPAPLTQELTGTDVYYLYDSNTMEIGRTNLNVLPEYFTIDTEQIIRELSLEEQVKEGLIQLAPDQKIVDNQIIDKTISEKIKDGLITLTPSQKVIGSGIEERIVRKTPSELIADNLLKLSKKQTIIGSGEDERIVTKSLEEQVHEGLLQLSPNQRIENDRIVTYSDDELFDKGLINLDESKKRKIEEFSELSFKLREEIIPDYKLVNASMDIYSESEKLNFQATVQAFRDEFYRLQKLVEDAPDIVAVRAVKENYPREIVVAGA